MEGINWHSLYFLLFALVACCFALGVVFTANIVRMAFYLIISLGATAGLFFLAGADFVGAMQLVLYVGGTLVLLVFGVMLTAQGPFVSIRTAGRGSTSSSSAPGSADCARPTCCEIPASGLRLSNRIQGLGAAASPYEAATW